MLSRNDIRPEQTQLLLSSGFLPTSIDYRLCPEKTLPEGPMTDVVDALAWVRQVLPQLSLQRNDVRVDGNTASQEQSGLPKLSLPSTVLPIMKTLSGPDQTSPRARKIRQRVLHPSPRLTSSTTISGLVYMNSL